MTDDRQHTALAGLTVVATLTLAQFNQMVAAAAGVCGLIIALPRAVKTIRETNWKTLLKRRR